VPLDRHALQQADWAAAFPEAVLARGRSCAKQGLVRILRVTAETIEARCHGGAERPYRQDIRLSPQQQHWRVQGRCSCPVAYNCKHVVAALLLLEQLQQRGDPLAREVADNPAADPVRSDLPPQPRLRLGSVRRQHLDTLSKGFRRRVGFAAAILHDAPVLLLDEPTDGLDPNQKHEVRGLIRELARERTVLLSTHILEEVEAICTRIILISQGRVVVDETPAELLARSRYQGAVSLVAADSIAARAALDGMPGVSGFQQEGAEGRLYVFPQGRPVSPEAVSARLRERGVEYSGLQPERGRLDEVFRRITTAEVQA